MGISLKIDAEAGVIIATAIGEIDIEEFRAYRTRLVIDPLYDPDLAMLYDARNGILNIGPDEAYSLGNWTKAGRRFSKIAIVTREDMVGTTRMFLGSAGDDYNGRIFHNMTPAREWLGLPPE